MADLKIGASYIDFSAVAKFSSSFELNMILYPQGLDYGIIDGVSGNLVALEDFDMPQPARSLQEYCSGMREFFNRTEWAQKAYNQVRIAVDNPYFTLMPEVLYDGSKKKDYLGFNMNLPDELTVYEEPMESMGSVFVYGLPSCLDQLLRTSYPETRPCHARVVLLKNLHQLLHDHPKGDVLYIFFKKNEFDITLFRDGKLMLVNTFLFTTKEDVVYYILFVMDQLHADPSSTEVRLAGNIEKDSEIYGLLMEYIRDISLLEYTSPFRLSSMLERIPLHRYFNLLHLSSCE